VDSDGEPGRALNSWTTPADAERVKRSWCIVLLAATMVVTACSSHSSPPATFGVDGAPQLVQDAFLTVTEQAAMLAGYDATKQQWLDFAREVCAAGLHSSKDIADFAAQQPGAEADSSVTQMWSTVVEAATTSFCPMGES
jgi:hypothetical protein